MIIFVNNKRDVLLEFFLRNNTKEIHIRELSRLVGISFPWTRKIALEFAGQGLLKKRITGGLVLIKADKDAEGFKQVKRSYNLLSMYKTGLVEYLNEHYGRPEAIILFGSYSRGEDTEDSDVDIGIITTRSGQPELAKMEKLIGRKIRIQEILREKADAAFWNTLANGIILSGYLELP